MRGVVAVRGVLRDRKNMPVTGGLNQWWGKWLIGGVVPFNGALGVGGGAAEGA